MDLSKLTKAQLLHILDNELTGAERATLESAIRAEACRNSAILDQFHSADGMVFCGCWECVEIGRRLGLIVG